MADSPPPLTADTHPEPLSAGQRAQAEALYRHLLHLKRMDVSMMLVSFGETVSVRPIGRRVDISVSVPAVPMIGR